MRYNKVFVHRIEEFEEYSGPSGTEIFSTLPELKNFSDVSIDIKQTYKFLCRVTPRRHRQMLGLGLIFLAHLKIQ